MKIYTITQATYLNADGEFAGTELEALSATARSFRDRRYATDELMSWIADTIHDYYGGDDEVASDKAFDEACRSTEKVPDSDYCYMKNRVCWELRLCGYIYKWQLFEQEI